jgi:quercetin dioxygenase-like cupin family protein
MQMKSIFAISAAALSCFCALCAASAETGGPASGATPGVVVARKADLKIEPGPEKYFTGRVQIAGQFQREEPSRVTGAIVSFTPGARTAWHTHPAGQTLIVTDGIGLVQNWGGSVQEIRSGDVIWIPPGVKHWHGATGSDAMTHIAIQEKVNGSNVEWMEYVTEEQFTQANGGRKPS